MRKVLLFAAVLLVTQGSVQGQGMMQNSSFQCRENVRIRITPAEIARFNRLGTESIIISKDLRYNTTGLSEKCITTPRENNLNFNYTDCASYTEIKNGSICFTYLIRNVPIQNASLVITRHTDVCFNRTCCIDTNELLTARVLHPRIQKKIVGLLSRNGTFQLEFKLYAFPNFTTELTNQNVKVPNWIYARIRLTAVVKFKENYFVQVRSCWATPTANPKDNRRYDIISRGCALNHTNGLMNTINVTRNYEELYAAFSFCAFVWAQSPTSSVFVHCEAHICYNYTNNCPPKMCPPPLRPGRDVSQEEETKVVSVGPFFSHLSQPEKISCAKNNGGCSDYCSLRNAKVVCSCGKGRILTSNEKVCIDKPTSRVSFLEAEESNTLLLLTGIMLGSTVLAFVFICRRISNSKKNIKVKNFGAPDL